MTGDVVELSVNGRAVRAARGTTVASAILNAGITTFRTSVGGDARAAVCGMGVCFECRVTIDGVAHQRSCLVPVRAGMVVATSDGE